MVFGLPFAHIPSCFAKDGHGCHHIDAVNECQIRAHHAKQLRAEVESWAIAFLFLESSLALLFRQRGALAPIWSVLEIRLEMAIAFGHLLLTKFKSLLLLLQHKQQIDLPVAL